MARKKKRKKSSSQAGPTARGRKRRYSAGELFIAVLGAAIVILFIGIIVTSILGD